MPSPQRFSKSDGITEGFHNKMEMISRRTYGFRNFENYRLRVLALCGWEGVLVGGTGFEPVTPAV